MPPNVKFILDDVRKELLDKNIDFVFARDVLIQDWEGYTKNMFDCLRPGGRAEIQFLTWEPITDLEKKPRVKEWADYQAEAMQKAGFVTKTAVEVKELMRSTGFSEVQEQTVELPMCGKKVDPRLRRLSLEIYANQLEAISLALFFRHLKQSRVDVLLFLALVREQMEDPDTPFSWPL